MSDTFFKAYQDQIEAAKKAFSTPNGLPALEVPPAVREAAEKGLAAARENYEKIKVSASQVNSALENSYSTASKGVTLYNARVIEALEANVTSAFDYFNALLQAKTVAEAVDLSATHLRKQVETLTTQAKDLSTLAQQVAADSSAPIKESVEKTFRSAA